MPELRCGGGGDESKRRGGAVGVGGELVERIGATAANNLAPSVKILNRKTTRVIFNRNGVINGKLTSTKKIFDDTGNN